MTRTAFIPSGGRAARAQHDGLRLFDDVGVQHLLVARFLTDEPMPLRSAGVPRSPGVYGLRYHGTHTAYAALDDHRFVYVGKSAYLPERISSHVASLDQARDLGLGDFSVVVLALDSLMHAEVAEHLLIGAFDPLWCRPGWRGFGSRPQGTGRRSQAPTNWDRRHPGRVNRTQVRARAGR